MNRVMNPNLTPAAQKSHLYKVIRTDPNTIEWRLALVDLAILEGQLPKDLPVHSVSFLHSTRVQ